MTERTTLIIDGRNVELMLPPGDLHASPVLLAHDGQNCFDGAQSLAGTGWFMQEAVPRIAAELGVPIPIVIAPWNAGAMRGSEYAPEDVLRDNAGMLDGFSARYVTEELTGNRYVTWCVERVLGYLRNEHGVELARHRTAIIGSSMGGLASLYALAKRPDVYGAALCLSTHWTPGGQGFPTALVRMLPSPGEHRLWFDHGDQGLDAEYAPYQREADRVLAELGWGEFMQSRAYAKSDHHETAWAERLPEILRFWLTHVFA